MSVDPCKFCHQLSSMVGSSPDDQFLKSCNVACNSEWKLPNCDIVCKKLLNREITCDELPICASPEIQQQIQNSQQNFGNMRNNDERSPERGYDYDSRFSSGCRCEELENTVKEMALQIKKLEHNQDQTNKDLGKIKEILAGDRGHIRETIESIERIISPSQGERKESEVDTHVDVDESEDDMELFPEQTVEKKEIIQQDIKEIKKEQKHEHHYHQQQFRQDDHNKEEKKELIVGEDSNLLYSYISILILGFIVYLVKRRSDQFILARQEEIFGMDDPMPLFNIFDTREKLALLVVRVATILLCAFSLGKELFLYLVSFTFYGSFEGMNVTSHSLAELSFINYFALELLFGVILGLCGFIIENEGLYNLHILDFNKWVRVSTTLCLMSITFFGLTNYKNAVFVFLLFEYSNLIATIVTVTLWGTSLLDLIRVTNENPFWAVILDQSRRLKVYSLIETIIKGAVLMKLQIGYETNFAAAVWMLFLLHCVDLIKMIKSLVSNQFPGLINYTREEK